MKLKVLLFIEQHRLMPVYRRFGSYFVRARTDAPSGPGVEAALDRGEAQRPPTDASARYNADFLDISASIFTWLESRYGFIIPTNTLNVCTIGAADSAHRLNFSRPRAQIA